MLRLFSGRATSDPSRRAELPSLVVAALSNPLTNCQVISFRGLEQSYINLFVYKDEADSKLQFEAIVFL